MDQLNSLDEDDKIACPLGKYTYEIDFENMESDRLKSYEVMAKLSKLGCHINSIIFRKKFFALRLFGS